MCLFDLFYRFTATLPVRTEPLQAILDQDRADAGHEPEHQQRVPEHPQEHGGQGRHRRLGADPKDQPLQRKVRGNPA